jgi:universal stress protein E
MKKLTSILVVVDPQNEMHRTLQKALMLARRFGASLELFLCDSQRAYALKHSYVTEEIENAWRAAATQRERFQECAQPSLLRNDLEKARQSCLDDGLTYLRMLKASLHADDVRIAVDVACHSPLFESIVHKVRETGPDLVIKSASGSHPLRRMSWDHNDWQLARTCPATLMLTQNREWAAAPRFAAAVDISASKDCSLARMILHTSDYLAAGCEAELDLLYSEPSHDDTPLRAERQATLSRLAAEHEIEPNHIHVLPGDAERTLPRFAAGQNYDALVFGALTRRHGLASLMGTLTSKLVDALDCDFVLVKPENFACYALEPQAVGL